MKKYFIHINSEQSGPFSIEELEKMSISRETPTWHEGLEEWTIAGEIDELKSLFKVVPPPFHKSEKENEGKSEKINAESKTKEKKRIPLLRKLKNQNVLLVEEYLDSFYG